MCRSIRPMSMVISSRRRHGQRSRSGWRNSCKCCVNSLVGLRKSHVRVSFPVISYAAQCVRFISMPSHPNEGKRVLGLFVKQPIPGQAKTRLAAATTPAWAVQVAEAALRDTVGRLAGIDAERVLGYTPMEAEPYFADLVQQQFLLQPQSAGDLGQRMAAFLARQLQQGAGKAVLLGTDSPTLPVEFIEEAFRRLEHADVVLGP